MMRREDYKVVKHMDKTKMEKYLETIYPRGYRAGVNTVADQMKKNAVSGGVAASAG